MAKKTSVAKRVLAWFCVVLMVVMMLPISVFAEGEHDIAGVISNGTMVFKIGETPVTKASSGDEVVVDVTPNAGYKLTALTAGATDILTEKKFEMPDEDITVTATISAKSYSVTAGAVSNGTLTVSVPYADEGETIAVTAEPDSNYKLSALTYTQAGAAEPVDIDKDAMSFVIPAADVIVNAEFTPVVTVTGTVTSTADGAPAISGASVTLKNNEDNSIVYTTTTGDDGTFSIADVFNIGTYTCTVSASTYKGYSNNNQTITSALDVSLTPKANGTVTFDDATVSEGVAIGYGESVTKAASAGAGDTRTVNYKSDNTGVATVGSDGSIVTTGVGTAVITAYCEENEDYNYSEATYVLTVTKGTQAAFTWDATGVPSSIAWNTTFTKTAVGGSGSEAIVYSSSDTEVATVDEAGLVTPLKPGNVTISAYKRGGDLYNDTDTITYSLKIKKATQTISFSETTMEYTTGQAFVAPALSVTNTINASGAVTYSSSNTDVATVASDTGVVTFTLKPGTVTISAVKEADDYYLAADEVSYTVNVSEWALDTNKTYYSVVGEQKNSSGWYTSNVSLSATLGYELCKSKDGSWTEALADVITADSDTAQTVSFYVKDTATGAISETQYVTVKKDATAPTGSITHPQESAWNKLLNIFQKKDSPEFFEIASEDQASGIKSVEYIIDSGTTVVKTGDDFDALTGWITYTDGDTIDTPADQYFVLYVRLTDNAGNIAYLDTNGIIYDTTNPDGITLTPNAANSNGYYNSDVTVQVSAQDTGVTGYSGIKSITYSIAADGVETENGTLFSFAADATTTQEDLVYSWSSEDEGNIPITVNAAKFNSDNVCVTVTVTDNAGNSKSDCIQLKINSTPPTVSTTGYDKGGLVRTVDGREYYTTARTMTVTITDRDTTFDQTAAQTAIENAITVENANSSGEYSITWDNSATGTYVATVVFAADAKYTVNSFVYTNKAGTFNDGVTGLSTPFAFTVDASAPINNKVEALESSWNDVISALTFKLYDPEIIVITPSADDATSPVEFFYYKSNDTTALSRTALDALAADAWTKSNSLTVDEDEQFTVYVKIIDYAGNYEYVSTDGLIVDKTQLAQNGITLTTDRAANTNGYYNDDVVFSVAVADSSLVGIKSVDYTIKSYDADGIELESEAGNLYTFGITAPTAEDLRLTWNSTDTDGNMFTVNAEKFNSDDVRVQVTVTDNLDRVTESAVYALKINSTPPTISASYGKDGLVRTAEGREYYTTARTMTVTITDRDTAFDQTAAQTAIENAITVENANASGKYTIAWDNTTSGIHIATVTFAADANYTVNTFTYINKADQFNIAVAGLESAFAFTVDTTKPIDCEVTAMEKTWTRIIETLTFGLWKSGNITVTPSADDATSPFEYFYYKSNDTTALSRTALDALEDGEWTKFERLTIGRDEQFTVYVKIMDYAGNYEYVSTNGLIVDTTPVASDDFTLTPDRQPNANGYYNSDVTYTVTVKDASLAGIREVQYSIESAALNTSEAAALYEFEYANPTDAVLEEHPLDGELLHTVTKTFTVDKTKFNADDIKVTVTVTDNAGNVTIKEASLKINSTAPTMEISFDNNNEYKIEDGRGYFPADRTATIVITDRTTTFNADEATQIVNTAISAMTDRAGETVADAYTLSEWTTVEGIAANGDDATHTATVTFSADANYTISSENLVYKNKADVRNSSVDTKDSVTPYLFTVDTTKPIDCEVTAMEKTWTKIIEMLTFGLWKSGNITVTPSADDATSPVEYFYYKSNDTTALSRTALDALADGEWTKFERLTIDRDEQFTVYVKIMDYAGNYEYVSTNGLIVDTTPVASDDFTLTPDRQPNANGYYNSDVTYTVTVKDASFAGIREVRYRIESAALNTSEAAALYEFEYANPTDAVLEEHPLDGELLHTVTKTFTVDKTKFNADDIKVTVTVTDNAGNVTTKEASLKINSTAPTMEISFDNNNEYKIEDGRGYFPADRTATIVITDRTTTFNADEATQIVNTAISAMTDRAGETVADAYTLSEWTTAEGIAANGDDATHTATVEFKTDANFTISESALVYTNLADMANTSVDTGVSHTPYVFTVDKVIPEGTITITNNAKKWSFINKLLDLLSFSRWTDTTVTVKSNVSDATAGIESVRYYKSNQKVIEDITQITWTDCTFDENKEFTILSVEPDERFAVYLQIVDNAGNTQYISSDGIIVDNTSPIFGDQDPPVVSVTPLNVPSSGYYTGDATVQIAVFDPIINDSYSGLKRVWYEVTSLGEITQTGDLYNFSGNAEEALTWSDLRQTWNSTDADGHYITVDSSLNNSNEVVVTVWAQDNAGKVGYASADLKIDITAPTISVSYDNNSGDSSVGSSTYFNATRTATITITERNFSESNVVVNVTNTNGAAPGVVGWIHSTGGGNGDGSTHIATISYTSDGDYTFSISFTDDAGLQNSSVYYGSSLAPTAFTIDLTNPVIAVSYDNNEALNDNYYKESRTATLTITEHNFEISRITVTMTATDDGTTIEVPAVNGWTTSGDTHTATIAYDTDGLYTFDIAYADMAGNQAADYAGDTFYVDLTAPSLSISNIVDESANNSRGKIGFVITAADTNFDIFTPVVTAVVREGNQFVTKSLEIGTMEDTRNGVVYTVDNIDIDGIYRITCTVTDKAGNSFTQVLLENSDGTTYLADKTEEDTLVTFSVNREGSTFELDENTMDVVGKYYVQNVLNDVMIIEINTDELDEYEVTLNGTVLTEGTDYTVDLEGGGDKWYRYTYSVNKDLFADEGEYQIVVSSKDKAGSDAFSDVKGAEITFVVDRTAPVVVVTGLETNGRYQVERQTVTLIPTDDGGALNTLIVWLVDNDGNMIRELVNLEGEDLLNALEAGDGKITFEIEEGLYQNVRIICTDCAVDEVGHLNTYDEMFTNVSVSSSGFMIFWANKPLRYGTIGGIVVVLGGGGGAVVTLKRKKASKAAAK